LEDIVTAGGCSTAWHLTIARPCLSIPTAASDLPAAASALLATREPLAEGFLPIVLTGATGAAASDAPAVETRESFPLAGALPRRGAGKWRHDADSDPEHLGVLTARETWAEINVGAPDLGLRMSRVCASSHFRCVRPRTPIRWRAAGVVTCRADQSCDGWGVSRGANPLVVIGDAADAASGLPDWYSTSVRLIPV
jgi:hypothetical protein